MRFALGVVATYLAFTGLRLAEEPTFDKDIGPIMIASCAPCHRSGGPAPFPLQTYEDVEKRANQIAQTVIGRKMPPNRASSEIGPFTTHDELTQEQIALIQRWATGAKARGAGVAPPPLPQAPEWPMGPPDLILRPQEPYLVRPDHAPHWKIFRIPLPKNESLKVKAFDIKPSSPNVIRYVELSVDGPPSGETAGLGAVPAESILAAWTYGHRNTKLPPDAIFDLSFAKYLFAHVLIVPSGRLQSAEFEVGLYLGEGSSEPQTLIVGLNEGYIPPSPAYTATASLTLPFHSRVLAIFPQARDLAAEITVIAIAPDGQRTTLFHYDGYHPLWIGAYRLARPFEMAPNSTLVASIRYDNSTHSARNRDRPPQRVPIGEAENEEPCRVGIQVLIP